MKQFTKHATKQRSFRTFGFLKSGSVRTRAHCRNPNVFRPDLKFKTLSNILNIQISNVSFYQNQTSEIWEIPSRLEIQKPCRTCWTLDPNRLPRKYSHRSNESDFSCEKLDCWAGKCSAGNSITTILEHNQHPLHPFCAQDQTMNTTSSRNIMSENQSCAPSKTWSEVITRIEAKENLRI